MILSSKEDYAIALMAEYMKYEGVKEKGSNSPTWTDGQELNHIRDSIVYLKKQMESLNFFPEIYYKETPAQVPQRYMLNADVIRKKAKETLQTCKSSEDYKFIFSHGGLLSEQQRGWICLDGIVNDILRMERMIRIDNLVKMKKYSDATKYLKGFKVCRRGLEELLEEMRDLEPPEEPKEPEVIYEQMKLSDYEKRNESDICKQTE